MNKTIKTEQLSMYDASNLSPPNSCSPHDTIKHQSTNLLTNHHSKLINQHTRTSDLFFKSSAFHFNMSTTTLSPSSNSSCSAAISPTYNTYNTYLPAFNSTGSIESRSNNYLINETNDLTSVNTPTTIATNHHYLENYQNSLINHHNSPNSSPSSLSSTPFSTTTNLHNHFTVATNQAAVVNSLNAHSLNSTHHSNSSNPINTCYLTTGCQQTDLINHHHSSLSNSLSNSMHHLNNLNNLNNQNSSFSFNHSHHQPNHQLNLSSFNHLHHDTSDLNSTTNSFRNSATGTSLTTSNNNPMLDSMLNNQNHLTSLTNLTGLNTAANTSNAINSWNSTNIDYFINSNSNKFLKIERGRSPSGEKISISYFLFSNQMFDLFQCDLDL